MTTTGENRARYADTHPNDPRPSRFSDPGAYSKWAARADSWAEREGLARQPKPRRTTAPKIDSGRMVRVSADTWVYRLGEGARA